MDKRLKRLLRAGRAIEPLFAPKERLYLRCRPEMIGENDHVLPASIRCNGQSCNRGKFSEPDDVLYPDWLDWGVAELFVKDIPAVPPVDCMDISPHKYEFAVEHIPLEENYSHSEIRAYKNGLFCDKTEPGKLIKKWFRAELSLKTRIIRKPKI